MGAKQTQVRIAPRGYADMNGRSGKKAVNLQLFFLVLLFLAAACFVLFRIPLIKKTNLFFASKAESETQTPQIADIPEPSPLSRRINLLACGDILLSRSPGKRAEENGYRYLFTGVREAVRSADFAFANLECPAAYIGEPYPGKPEVITFRADPESLFGLKWAGFDIVSLANNHMNDYGPRALSETLDYLDLLGIARCGAGKDAAEARAPVILEKNGVKVAFLAYAEPIWSVIEADDTSNAQILLRAEKSLSGLPAIKKTQFPDKPGIGPEGVAIAKIDDISQDVRRVQELYKPDYLFVSVHWGEEHQHYPQNRQMLLGRAIIDAGATAVLGHHPHVLQGIEVYNGGAILYSMGNFVFDMRSEKTYESAFFELSLDAGILKSIRITPVRINHGSYIPSVAQGEDALAILENIRRWSGSSGKNMEIIDNFGILPVNDNK